MTAHVFLNLLNELGERNKMQCLPSMLSLVHTELNKFNYTGAQMFDSIYHMTLKLIKKSHFWHVNNKILPSFTQCQKGRHYITLLNL